MDNINEFRAWPPLASSSIVNENEAAGSGVSRFSLLFNMAGGALIGDRSN
jgi:hypothetical protein